MTSLTLDWTPSYIYSWTRQYFRDTLVFSSFSFSFEFMLHDHLEHKQVCTSIPQTYNLSVQMPLVNIASSLSPLYSLFWHELNIRQEEKMDFHLCQDFTHESTRSIPFTLFRSSLSRTVTLCPHNKWTEQSSFWPKNICCYWLQDNKTKRNTTLRTHHCLTRFSIQPKYDVIFSSHHSCLLRSFPLLSTVNSFCSPCDPIIFPWKEQSFHFQLDRDCNFLLKEVAPNLKRDFYHKQAVGMKKKSSLGILSVHHLVQSLSLFLFLLFSLSFAVESNLFHQNSLKLLLLFLGPYL